MQRADLLAAIRLSIQNRFDLSGVRVKTSVVTKPIAVPVDFLELHELNPQRYPFLLESVARGPLGRYDILFAFPQETISLNSSGALFAQGYSINNKSFLGAFDRWFDEQLIARDESCALPFRGGWFVYLGYELASEIEPTLSLPAGDDGLPVAQATRIPAALVRDRLLNQTWWVAETEFAQHERDILDDFQRAASSPRAPLPLPFKASLREDEPQRYIDSVDAALAYIRAGDVFQANLSRAWQAILPSNVQPSDVYRGLRVNNPAPFAGIARLGETTILSSSPERLFCRRGDWIETRPIAGTRPRARDANGNIDQTRDDALVQELISHPKERAEHIMLIDLERNDIGRLAVPGTVEVNELMVVETYEHVHHIVSNVRGKLRAGATPAQIIRALFPGGTITGCPKVRCMEIIAELEQTPRNAYTGSMGYVNRDGDMDFNILIRTLMQQGNNVTFRTGAGIVADSNPQRELEETRAKARGSLKVFGL